MVCRALIAIVFLTLIASCSQTTSSERPEPTSLDATVAWLVARINESSTIRVEMGDKLVTNSTIVTRVEPCVLSIHDKKHTQLGGTWEASDIKATIDLRRLRPTIGSKEFEGSGHHGAVLTVSAPEGSGGIREQVDLSSSALGLTNREGPAETFEFTIADHDVAERIVRALERAIDLCRR